MLIKLLHSKKIWVHVVEKKSKIIWEEIEAISPIKIKVGFLNNEEMDLFTIILSVFAWIQCIKNRKITLSFNVQAYTSCITFLLMLILIYK